MGYHTKEWTGHIKYGCVKKSNTLCSVKKASSQQQVKIYLYQEHGVCVCLHSCTENGLKEFTTKATLWGKRVVDQCVLVGVGVKGRGI